MAGKQAKVLTDANITSLLAHTRLSRYPIRNRVIVLLSTKAGLRAGEIAKITWEMVLEPTGAVSSILELRNNAAKKGSGRRIPLHDQLRKSLQALRQSSLSTGPIVESERGGPMSPDGIANWFARTYRVLGLGGCSSHSGRRTFITKSARLVHRTGGSIRDVQMLAGHRSIEVTQRYIDGDTAAQRKLVSLI
jgi:integrase